jgi:hypothetical protein
MGRRKKRQEESVPDQTTQVQDALGEQPEPVAGESEEPEHFDPSLLHQPIAERLAYFENYRLDHTRLSLVLDAILRAILSPGEGPDLKRPGIMVLVIGPTRVGKTTLIVELEKRLLNRAKGRMMHDPGFMPFASITVPGESRFDWVDYSKAVLRQFKDPFVEKRSTLIRGRDYREAMEEAFIHRHPYAVIVDEAQHLAKAARGSRLQDQLDQLKYFENKTGVSHILVGTYDMRPFRKVNAQLACRTIDVHFSRYDATKDEDRALFKSILWALQCQLPLEKEPPLVEKHWQLLYDRCIGCVGSLKLHLNQALELALSEGAKTLTEAHLKVTAPHKDKVKLAFNTAIQGENDLFEGEDADKELLEMIWGAKKPAKSQEEEEGQGQTATDSHSKGSKPGNRSPGRDPVGSHSEEDGQADDE